MTEANTPQARVVQESHKEIDLVFGLSDGVELRKLGEGDRGSILRLFSDLSWALEGGASARVVFHGSLIDALAQDDSGEMSEAALLGYVRAVSILVEVKRARDAA